LMPQATPNRAVLARRVHSCPRRQRMTVAKADPLCVIDRSRAVTIIWSPQPIKAERERLEAVSPARLHEVEQLGEARS
jgi:bifunctional DNA-binding transcriptional regulator/antitoxin component of YhaV-PrlF toxin-antitoxin module